MIGCLAEQRDPIKNEEARLEAGLYSHIKAKQLEQHEYCLNYLVNTHSKWIYITGICKGIIFKISHIRSACPRMVQRICTVF